MFSACEIMFRDDDDENDVVVVARIWCVNIVGGKKMKKGVYRTIQRRKGNKKCEMTFCNISTKSQV